MIEQLNETDKKKRARRPPPGVFYGEEVVR